MMKSTLLNLIFILSINCITQQDLLNKLNGGDLNIQLSQQELDFIQAKGVPIKVNESNVVTLNDQEKQASQQQVQSKSNVSVNDNAKNQEQQTTQQQGAQTNNNINMDVINDFINKQQLQPIVQQQGVQTNNNIEIVNETNNKQVNQPIEQEQISQANDAIPKKHNKKHYDTKDNEPVVASATSLDTCYVGGMQHMLCKGICPRCWKKETYGWSCFDYAKNTKHCPFDNMTDKGNDLPPQTVDYFKDKVCHIAGDSKNTCSFEKNCPPCWVIDYKTQNLHCYQKNSVSGQCDRWEGMMDITKLK